jgi:hypothetical protein
VANKLGVPINDEPGLVFKAPKPPMLLGGALAVEFNPPPKLPKPVGMAFMAIDARNGFGPPVICGRSPTPSVEVELRVPRVA